MVDTICSNYSIMKATSRSINWINPSPPKRLLGVQVPHGTHPSFVAAVTHVWPDSGLCWSFGAFDAFGSCGLVSFILFYTYFIRRLLIQMYTYLYNSSNKVLIRG